MFIWEKMDDPYIYGPLTAEQIDAILVPHHMVPEPDGFYIGTTIPQPQWDFCKIIIPVENSNEVNANNIIIPAENSNEVNANNIGENA